MWGLVVPESGDLPMAQSVGLPVQRPAKGSILEQVAVGQGVSIRRECGTQQAHDCTPATRPYIFTAPTQCTLAIQLHTTHLLPARRQPKTCVLQVLCAAACTQYLQDTLYGHS